ncbi:hypothetical protein B0H34DRAFT_105753 [Crassisporium funariophilum]|nr:hypothetical protein B0H34DRAFT_105753 [Crassisporium funariophilum]
MDEERVRTPRYVVRSCVNSESPSHKDDNDLERTPSPSPPPVCSPSPIVGAKRTRSEETDINAALGLVKAQKINDNTGRPKASDYDDVGKEVILAAANIYRCLISTVDGFPDSATELDFVRAAWKQANDDAGLQPIALTPAIGKIIKQRGSQTRGEAKTKMGAMVETMYGFDSGHGRKTVAANRKLVEELKFEKGFIYKAHGVIQSTACPCSPSPHTITSYSRTTTARAYTSTQSSERS